MTRLPKRRRVAQYDALVASSAEGDEDDAKQVPAELKASRRATAGKGAGRVLIGGLVGWIRRKILTDGRDG
jgi:hypothetical protein